MRARKWFDDLVSGRAASLKAIARTEDYSDSCVSHLVPLAVYASEVVEAILAATLSVDLTAKALTKRTDLPFNWAEQKEVLGFD